MPNPKYASAPVLSKKKPHNAQGLLDGKRCELGAGGRSPSIPLTRVECPKFHSNQGAEHRSASFMRPPLPLKYNPVSRFCQSLWLR
jgi:hypothetical protein